jgi:lipopolysaccharide export LptBFGC system permease protein LptF
MKGSIFTSFLVIAISAFLIIRLSKKSSSNRYEKKSKNQWNSLSEGVDPTDE